LTGFVKIIKYPCFRQGFLTDPDNFLFSPNSRKYFLCTLGAPYNLELELDCPSGWMHINGIYIGYRTKINPDEKYFAEKYILMIF